LEDEIRFKTEQTEMIITPEDELQLKERGMTLADLIAQIELFTKDIQPVKLEKPCVVSDGILQLNGAECNRLAAYYDQQKQGLQILGFIPASYWALSLQVVQLVACSSIYTIIYPTMKMI